MQLYHLTEEVLCRLVGQGTYSDAQNAYDRFIKIKTEGGSPTCFYSKSNGFSILDENKPDDLKRSMAMDQRATPFPI